LKKRRHERKGQKERGLMSEALVLQGHSGRDRWKFPLRGIVAHKGGEGEKGIPGETELEGLTCPRGKT